MPVHRFLDDLQVGERRQSPAYTLTLEQILDFARQFDPQPMHLDAEVAARGPFGGLIASGWHTAALTMRMMADAALLGDAGDVLGMGVDNLRWPRPVYPGDTLQADIEIASIRTSNSNPAFGIVKLNTTVRNQRGEVVYTVSPSCWVPRRPVSA